MNCSSKKCTTNCSILIFIIILLIHIYIVLYLNRLHNSHSHNSHNSHNSHGCECLDNNKSKNQMLFIKYYSIITIILVVIILFNKVLCSILNITLTRYYPYLKPFYLIYSITGFVSIYLLYNLTNKLKLKNCKCGGKRDRDILYYYSIMVISIYVFVIFMATFISICHKDLKILNII